MISGMNTETVRVLLVAATEEARGVVAPPWSAPNRTPASADVLEAQVMNMLYGSPRVRTRPAPRRRDGRTQAQVNRAARLRALKLGWADRGIPWSQEVAEALIAGQMSPALRHFEAHGAI